MGSIINSYILRTHIADMTVESDYLEWFCEHLDTCYFILLIIPTP
ncbi:hypothetical protein VCRA2113O411_270059 [Vibrio crassostreae]|nr:hypothetical protein VCRA2119O432_250010 [Vibrio crassostreae]CAK1933299.1 hypothetical protein VCRA2113O413_250010 [Vibrio crassostreae]CAK1938699.1 hypothetical protein VCRA2114O423_250060 [Vibrio crassostreae]CAK1954402.1 hypothetical protein VCRA2113O414_260059 [Vibrio crassostreae]CAK1955474.1 hypothetical protein VCRA2113O411_270059 [Vibrio crassostreae]